MTKASLSFARNEEQQKLLKTIGIFNDSFPPVMDGVALCTQNYARWIYEKNIPVCVVTPNCPHHFYDEPYPVYRYLSIPVINRKPYRMGIPELDPAIRKRMDTTPFGLVHAHSPFSSGALADRMAKKRGIPLVATFHSKFRDDFERAVYNKHIAKIMVKIVVEFFEKADEVWIPQASVEDTIREYGFKGHVEVVDNGNDFATKEPVESFRKAARKKLRIADNEWMFLFVGQHIWEKNTRLILETLAKITDIPFQMFFVGTGYAAAGLKSLSSEWNLSGRVHFEGVVTDRKTIKEYYAAADLFLFPSLYDNAPLVVREAGAMHTPSVMVRGSTAAAVIEDNINGFLIENTVDSFVKKIRELYVSPDKIKPVGLRASQTIARSWENVADEVIDRYIRLIRRKRNG
jgi:glycosyltransferase involved in cell wall biosynthesis